MGVDETGDFAEDHPEVRAAAEAVALWAERQAEETLPSALAVRLQHGLWKSWTSVGRSGSS